MGSTERGAKRLHILNICCWNRNTRVFRDKGDAGPRTSTGDSLSSTSENTSLSVTEGASGPFLQKKIRGGALGDEGM